MPLAKYKYASPNALVSPSINTPRKQYLRAKGWIPPKSYTPPLEQHIYNAHPAPAPITVPSSEAMTQRQWQICFPRSRKAHVLLRANQIIFALIVLIMLCYSGVHHGWWRNLGQPLGFGITASLLTLVIAIPTIFGYTSTAVTASHRAFFLHFMRVIAEFVLIALWSATFATMLLPKGKDFKLLFERPPYAEWDVAACLSAFEM
ncbi:hypothetical protein ACLMJK_004820 [Lecanora helva]